eukprot:sb/3469090/
MFLENQKPKKKPKLNVRKGVSGRPVRGRTSRLLVRSPLVPSATKSAVSREGPPTAVMRRLRKKNFIKANIERVKGRQQVNQTKDGRKTRVVYDVKIGGNVYRVLPCHVRSGEHPGQLSVSIDSDCWVEVPKSKVVKTLEYIGSIQAFKPPKVANRDNDIWVYRCKVGGRNFTIDPQDVKICPKDGCTYLVHVKGAWHQLDPWGVCKLLRGQISQNTIVQKSTEHAPRPPQPYKCSFSRT